nr:MAG TPA: hypothetical protein [Caudoviricetes sp.]
MLNDSRCESILLDVGEDARVDSDLPVLYLDVTGKRYGCTLNIVGGEYSVTIRNTGTNETITTVKGREGAWELRELLAEIKTKLWGDK